MKRIAALLVCLLLAVPATRAAATGVSAAVWRISGNDIVLRYTFPKELAALLARPGRPSPSTEVVARYVLSRVSAQRQGEGCEALDQGYDLGRIDTLYAGPDVLSFEVLFSCPAGPGPLLLRNDAFFDVAPGEVGIANIGMLGMPSVLRLITAGNASISVPAGRLPEASGLTAYVGLGLKHTLTSITCLCSALGLLLLLRERRELITVVCGLLAGYLLTALASGAGGWIEELQPSQAFGGFLVFLLGALLAARASGRTNAVALGVALTVGIAAATAACLGHHNVALCLVGAGIFGALLLPLSGDETIVHWLLPGLGALVGGLDGLSLAARFAPLHSVIALATAPLLAYNMGAMLGALTIFAAVAGARLLLRRFAGFSRSPVYTDVLTAALTASGAFSMLVL